MFDSAQSFVIKVWLERAARDAGLRGERTSWRGQITQVPGGERHAVQRLDEISDVIASVLERAGVDLGWGWRWRRRWRRMLGRSLGRSTVRRRD